MIAEILSADGKSVVDQIVLADGADPAAFGASSRVDPASAIGWIKTGSTWGPPAVAAPVLSGAALTAAVNAETKRRIYAVASDTTQMNIIGYIATGTATTADQTAFRDSVAWIAAMRAVCQSLISSGDQTYALDSHWPACPADVAALAARF